LPDGQQYGWMPGEGFAKTRGLVRGNDDPIQKTAIMETLRPQSGFQADDVLFERLQYAPAAIENYALFSKLREEGKIEPGVRYQMSIPTPFTMCICFDWDVVRELWPVLERRLLDNVAELEREIPHDDLAISWDVVAEFMLMVGQDARDSYSFEELVAGTARLIDAVPTDVEAGLHFCYGGHNSNGNIEYLSERDRRWLTPAVRPLTDTELMARTFTAIDRGTARDINWVHMPVPRHQDEYEYFAPLQDLSLGDETDLYLGLIHLEDGVEGTRKKLDSASRTQLDFGVAAACGLGNPAYEPLTDEHIGEYLAYHRVVAEM
jgi:hypothetical protein